MAWNADVAGVWETGTGTVPAGKDKVYVEYDDPVAAVDRPFVQLLDDPGEAAGGAAVEWTEVDETYTENGGFWLHLRDVVTEPCDFEYVIYYYNGGPF